MNRKPVTASALLATLLTLMLPAQLPAQNTAVKPGKPAWTMPLEIKSDTGKARLEWTPKSGEAVELYRLTEHSDGADQVSYVEGETLDVYRVNPGDYQFSLEACVKDREGFPLCGPKSNKAVLIVTEAVWAAYLAAGRPAGDTPIEPVLSVPGGPDDLRPGLWYDAAKVGQAWSIYWANRLALSQNPSNAYDLYVIWYTYEAKRRVSYCDGPDDTCPPVVHEYYDYRPVVATMALAKHQSNNTYVGAITIKRGGTPYNVGSATITFGENNRLATISWTATFKKQALLSGSDNIALLAGSSGTSTSDVSYLAGLWGDTDANQYIVDNLGSLSAAVEAIFYDDNGDPTWIQAYRDQVPVATDTPLCFYHVQGGYQPDLEQSVLQGSLYSDCDPDNATSTSRNGRRYFTGHETGRYWVSFSLPPGAVNNNGIAGGSLNMGSSTVPATLAKSASFHRIWFAGAESCQISTTSPNCATSLTWFTDGDYPNATAWAFNQTTAQRTLIKTSTDPAMENQAATLSAAGIYVFELRMSNSSSSTVMAESSPFTVTMVASSPIAPTNLAAVWSSETNRNYSLQWSHADAASIAYYHLEETAPAGSVTVYTVSPGTTLSKAFSRSSGPFGTYAYRVRACNSSALCSSYTAAINWVVTDPNIPPPTGGLQKPWGDNAYGTLTLNQAYNYALGYHFKPLVNGQVTQLGGLFNGVKTVKLFRRDSGALLAQATVNSANAWSYVSITPVNLTAGVEYTVAGYLAGSGASYRSGISLPKTYGDITILAGTSIPTSTDPQAVPTNNNSSVIYGQVDIAFQAGSAQQSPTISPISDQQNIEGQQVSLQVIASDPDGSIVSFGHGGSLPAGLSISNSGLISGPLTAGSAAGSPYSVTITASDNQGLTGQETFNWTVNLPNTAGGITVFSESFEGTLGGQWTQDAQNDWFVSTQRATAGGTSAEVDGLATDAQLISIPINLQGSTQASVSFNWYIESGLDTGEYLAFDVSTNGGASWTERARLNGNADPENAWRPVQLDLNDLASLRLRFRGTMSASDEDANVDDVVVTVPTPPVNTSANPETPPAPAGAPSMTPDATSSAVGATAGVFRVDDTGNATYSMPIFTAPGSGGLAPQISLDYSSRAGNGPLGVGWSLGGVSAITRCSRTLEQDGKSGQRGISLTANDRF
ncbi:MAG TPA: putative Ig domain-containing protein, partial [Xanthomonadales bacterium]|nr:putative Ig domain-containing protein [Xanthomonadales bacterium]